MLSKPLRTYVLLSALLVVLVAAYAAAGFMGVPRLLRSQLEQFTSEKYQRAISIGEIRFNPFTLALEMRDVSFPDADRAPLLAFKRLFVNVDVSSVWRRGASFKAIELEQPFARVLINSDGSLNLAALAKPLAEPADAAPEPKPASKPTRLFIDRLQVAGAELTFEDRTHSTPFRAQLKPITFDLRDFSTTGKTDNAYTLQGISAAGERFSWNGSFSLDPLGSRGHFALNEVQAHTLWSYLRDSLGFEVSSGVVGVSGDYDFAAAPAGLALQVNVGIVDVANLGIRPRGLDRDYVNLGRLTVQDTHLDLARQSVDVGKVRLTGGQVRAWREADGSINLLALAKAPASTTNEGAPPVATSNASSAKWVVNVPDIAVESLKIAAEDRFVKPAASFSIDSLDVHAKGFSTAPNAKVEVDAKVDLGEVGLLTARASGALEGPALAGRVEVKGLDLTAFQPYIGTYTQMTLSSGALTTHLDFDLPANRSLTAKGDLEVAQLRTVDNALRQDFIKWDGLKASGIEFRSEPAELKIAAIAANAPYMRVIIAPDQSVNIAQVLTTPPNAPGPVQTVRSETVNTNPAGVEKPMPISIGRIQVTNGAANFTDLWIRPNYAVSLQELAGSISGLTSDLSSRAKMKLEGKVDRYAPALIEGDVNLLSASLYTDLKVKFDGVDMASVTPYSGRFAGYRIEKGKLSIDVAYHVENRQLKAEQRFVIDQLQLGERVESPEAVHLPLKIAVALLKDRNGVIDIGLPVTGSLDDPKFRIGPIIWKAVVNLLTKIATAPFALLGSLFGGGEDMNLVDFEPGLAALDAGGQEKMAALLKGMKERPQLQLDVPGTFSPDLDRPVLAARKLEEKLMVLAAQQSSPAARKRAPETAAPSDPARRFDLLVGQYRLDFGADAALPAVSQEIITARKKTREGLAYEAANGELTEALHKKSVVSDQDLEALGQARARAIQDALLGQGEIEAARVFMIAATAKPPAAGKVRLELALK